MDSSKKEPSGFVKVLKIIFVQNIVYKIFALVAGFAIWFLVKLYTAGAADYIVNLLK